MAGFELEVFKIYVYNKMTLLGFSNVPKTFLLCYNHSSY